MVKAKPGSAVSRLNVDPLGALARFGTAGAPIETALAETVKLAGEARTRGASLTAILVDATIPHEAGASEAQELAFLAAALVAYLRAFESAGVSARRRVRDDRLRACRRHRFLPHRRQGAGRTHDHRAYR